MEKFKIETDANGRLTIHTTNKENRELAGKIKEIPGVAWAGSSQNYEITVHLGKMFEAGEVIQAIESLLLSE